MKLDDLKKFAENFKLNCKVPSDLIPILTKDKQQAIAGRIRNQSQAEVVTIKANMSETYNGTLSVVQEGLQNVNGLKGQSLDGIQDKITSLRVNLGELESKLETAVREEIMRSQALRDEKKDLYIKFDRLEQAQEQNQSQRVMTSLSLRETKLIC